MGPSSPAGGGACLLPHMTEVGTEARGTVDWDGSMMKCHASRLFLMGRRTRLRGICFPLV